MSRLLNDLARPQNGLQELIFNFLIYAAINLAFLILITLLLWPLGKLMLVVQLAKGYGLFWVVMIILVFIVGQIQNFFRLDEHSHLDAYVLSNLVPSSFLVAGWSAFAALTVQGFVATTSGWRSGILYLAGALSSYIAFTVTSLFFTGEIYKKVNLFLSVISFIVFAVWPASGRLLYGWFFNLF